MVSDCLPHKRRHAMRYNNLLTCSQFIEKATNKHCQRRD